MVMVPRQLIKDLTLNNSIVHKSTYQTYGRILNIYEEERFVSFIPPPPPTSSNILFYFIYFVLLDILDYRHWDLNIYRYTF